MYGMTAGWKASLVDYCVRLVIRAVVAFGLLAATATNLADLSEVVSALLIGVVFGASDVAERLSARKNGGRP